MNLKCTICGKEIPKIDLKTPKVTWLKKNGTKVICHTRHTGVAEEALRRKKLGY